MSIINYSLWILNQLGNWSYVIVLLVSFLESLAFVGTLIPGGLIIITIGYLALSSSLNIWLLIIAAAIGAILGDNFSYYLGEKSSFWFKDENKLLKVAHLEKAKIYFQIHGDKSIFLARFIGVIRPLVPFVAGLSKMNFKTFLFWNVTSAIAWSASNFFFGYFLSQSAKLLEINKKYEFLLITVPIIIVFFWTIIQYHRQIKKTAD